MATFIGKHARPHVEVVTRLYLPIDPETGEVLGVQNVDALTEILDSLKGLSNSTIKRKRENPKP